MKIELEEVQKIIKERQRINQEAYGAAKGSWNGQIQTLAKIMEDDEILKKLAEEEERLKGTVV